VSLFDRYIRSFSDRKDAGQKLALLLTDLKGRNALVLGIPRGGVEVAYYVAQYLRAELSVIVSKKLSYPQNEEYGFGAVSEEDSLYLSNEGYLTSEEETATIIEERKKEIERRVQQYREGAALPDMHGRTVALVDDGIATGVTLVPCIRLCRKHNAAKIIVASPVAGQNYNPHINEADEVRIAVQPELFHGVGQVYERFDQLTDEEVMKFLKKNKEEIQV
jgi:predicted phosphoribosyltransferase